MFGVEKTPFRLDGEKEAWDIIEGLDPENVCRRAKASFDGRRDAFTIKVFSAFISVSPKKRLICSIDKESERLVHCLGENFALTTLRYLIHASDVPFSGNLINPAELTGGHIYLKGAHVLPLHGIAQKYAADRDGFLARGQSLDGEQTNLGDAAFIIKPFPRIAVAVILWLKNDEFPARTILLVDSSCNEQLPADIMWLTAMMCVLAIAA